MGKVFDSDVGTKIRLDTGIDLSAAATVAIHSEDPNGTIAALVAAKYSTTYVEHTKTAATLAVPGKWTLQAHATWAGGVDHSGDPYLLVITESLKTKGSL